MKRSIFLLIGVLSLLTVVTACGVKPGKPDEPLPQTTAAGTNNGGSGESMDFQSIKISESGMMMGSTVYLAEKTEAGVHLEYYIGYTRWDEKRHDQVEDKNMIRQFDGDQALYQTIAELAGRFGLQNWDGFSGNNPDVLDGYSFSMDAVLADGSMISAHGSNKYPDGYHGFLAELDLICSRSDLTEQKFEMDDYEVVLPESWIGNVTAVYRDGYVGFEVQTDVQNRTLMCIYNEPYEYGDGKESYITAGSYQKDGETWYIVLGRIAESYSAYDEMNDVQKAMCDHLDEDMKSIAESLKVK